MSGVSKVAWPMRRGLIIVRLQPAGLFFSAESITAPGATQGAAAHSSLSPRAGATTLPTHSDRGFVAVQIRTEGAMAKSAGYKLATYQAGDGPRAGLVIDDKVFDAVALTRKPAYATVLGILADWRAADSALRMAAAGVGKSSGKGSAKTKSRPLARTKLLAPVRFPSAIYCAGSNYADHANEMAARDNRPAPPDPH